MDLIEQEQLPDEQRLALFYTPVGLRDQMAAFLALDRRLGQIAANTSEPMLGQMRLAWWREMLETPVSRRPRGDLVLEALGMHWAAREELLVGLANAWELLIATDNLAEASIAQFGAKRAAPFDAIFAHTASDTRTAISLAARRWALADAAARMSSESERSSFVEVGLALVAEGSRLPSDAKGLAVLGALAKRALKRGGRPLLEGRAAALIVLRAGLIGR